jgi:hypothetical protein
MSDDVSLVEANELGTVCDPDADIILRDGVPVNYHIAQYAVSPPILNITKNIRFEFYRVGYHRPLPNILFGGLLFKDHNTAYTFRDYGPFSAFDIKKVKEESRQYYITVHRSYLDHLQKSPIIPVDVINNNLHRMYGFNFNPFAQPYHTMQVINVLRDQETQIFFTDDDVDILKDLLGRQRVIGLYTTIRHEDSECGWRTMFLLLVDHCTAGLLDRLIFIYNRISKPLREKKNSIKEVIEQLVSFHNYLLENNITLKRVSNDIDNLEQRLLRSS